MVGAGTRGLSGSTGGSRHPGVSHSSGAAGAPAKTPGCWRPEGWEWPQRPLSHRRPRTLASGPKSLQTPVALPRTSTPTRGPGRCGRHTRSLPRAAAGLGAGGSMAVVTAGTAFVSPVTGPPHREAGRPPRRVTSSRSLLPQRRGRESLPSPPTALDGAGRLTWSGLWPAGRGACSPGPSAGLASVCTGSRSAAVEAASGFFPAPPWEHAGRQAVATLGPGGDPAGRAGPAQAYRALQGPPPGSPATPPSGPAPADAGLADGADEHPPRPPPVPSRP